LVAWTPGKINSRALHAGEIAARTRRVGELLNSRSSTVDWFADAVPNSNFDNNGQELGVVPGGIVDVRLLYIVQGAGS
jgi:hypothetical protein